MSENELSRPPEFIIHTYLDRNLVRVYFDEEPEFASWMMATEYMMCLTASKSNLGFEKCMELLMEGACTYKSEFEESKENEE